MPYKDKEKYIAYGKKWRADNPERVRENSRKRRAAKPQMIRANNLKGYGLDEVEVAKALQAWGSFDGRCQNTACGETRGPFHTDHCHKTNTFRGILCRACNVAMGRVGDDPQILRGLVEYLERFQ